MCLAQVVGTQLAGRLIASGVSSIEVLIQWGDDDLRELGLSSDEITLIKSRLHVAGFKAYGSERVTTGSSDRCGK